ncbi:MAG: hypothetical protein J7K31_01925 [Candidatus Aenigmarchaeota archaeon]|nr:hypothetical protein [Candidatus Aenigmarchaeota archaeon]
MKRRKPRPGPGDITLFGDNVKGKRFTPRFQQYNFYENTGRIDPDLRDTVAGVYLENTGGLNVGYGMYFPHDEVYV